LFWVTGRNQSGACSNDFRGWVENGCHPDQGLKVRIRSHVGAGCEYVGAEFEQELFGNVWLSSRKPKRGLSGSSGSNKEL